MLQPFDLLAAMRESGIALASITDHDTLDGYREFRGTGEGDGYPRLLPGVEINSVANDVPGPWDGELHILGYGMDPENLAFEAVLAEQRRLRAQRTDMILERLRALGMPVDEQLPGAMGEGVTSPDRPHVAGALVAAGHAENVDDAMRRILAHGAPGYVPRQGLGPRDAIDAIRAAGGLTPLAHFREAPDRPDVIDRLCDWGLGGLEVYHVSFDEAARTAVERVAADHRLLATGGSENHGDTWTYEWAQAASHVPDDVGDTLLDALGHHASAEPGTVRGPGESLGTTPRE